MKEKLRVLIGTIMLVILITFTFVINALLTRKDEENLIVYLDPELQRAMTYEQFEDGDEDIEGTDNVKFSAFFLRDIDGDGYADKIKGTCKEIGKTDTLYMEVIVKSEGYVKDGKIEMVESNFEFSAAIPKDNEVKKNYIKDNVNLIEFETISSGTDKILTGTITTGDYSKDTQTNEMIGKNINNYSKDDNKIIFTGTYVDGNNNEVEIIKEINLTIDWYGTVEASSYYTAPEINYYDEAVNEEEGTIDIKFYAGIGESKRQLIIKSNYIEGVIPDLNGYAPVRVKCSNYYGDFTYDEETKKFTLVRNAIVDDTGEVTSSIARYNNITIIVTYPVEAYESLEENSVILRLPIIMRFEGFNNPNDGFENPYVSNEKKATAYSYIERSRDEQAQTGIELSIGKITYNKLFISKEKPLNIYRGISSEESDDFYTVKWKVHTNLTDNLGEMVLKETPNNEDEKVDTIIKSDSSQISMEDITTNVGIFFTGMTYFEKNEEIKIYDDDTGILIKTFTLEDVNKYRHNNPYMYDAPVKHIRVVTNLLSNGEYIEINNIKELDDAAITDTYTIEEFNEFKYIRTNLAVYIEGRMIGNTNRDAEYENPKSKAEIEFNTKTLSTQKTEKGTISIITNASNNDNTIKWINGTFLIEFPKEILDVKINDVSINNTKVSIDSYEVLNINDSKFIKIRTSNETAATYTISVNVDLTGDPRSPTVDKQIYLYAINEAGEYYNRANNDIYDLDNDGNVEEIIHCHYITVKIVAPNNLITNQTVSEYDEEGSIVISPEIAELDPVFGENAADIRTAKIGAQIRNNYSNTVSEAFILGKIPFVGNTSVLSGKDLESSFNTTMKNTGIIVPENLENKVSVYYSENSNPNKDIEDLSNGWTLAEDIDDWSKIKTWLVLFGDTKISTGEDYTFYYYVEIPNDVPFNEISYSHHAVYFCLDTEAGKYRTQIEPNKVGITIVSRYKLKLTKYQKNNSIVVPGATYRISKLNDEGNIEESRTADTNAEGFFEMENLNTEQIYEIKEIRSPVDYDLNDDVIKINGNINRETGVVSVEKIEGNVKGEIVTNKIEDDYVGIINVEDEAKAKLVVTKIEDESEIPIEGVKFKITGQGIRSTGLYATTDENGVININGLKVGESYTLEEARAVGYYLNEPVVFIIENNEGIYDLSITDGEVKESNLITTDGKPVVNITMENKAIPTFNVVINKIEKGTGVEGIPTVAIAGAKFRLYENDKELGIFETDVNGQISLNNLKQSSEDNNSSYHYKLVEIHAPDGYAKTKDITFFAQVVNEQIQFTSNPETNHSVDMDNSTVNIIIEDSPSFKLIKKDGETNALLPNVKFAIYNNDDGDTPARNSKGEIIGTKEIINGKEYYTLTTNENGEIIADLPDGIYKAVEVEAEEKYDLTGQIKYFGIGESRKPQEGYITNWGTNIGGKQADSVKRINSTTDGGYIVGAHYESTDLEIGGKTFVSKGSEDILVVKYSDENSVEWATSFGGDRIDTITSVREVSDGGYLITGYFDGESIEIGENTYYNQEVGKNDSFIVKLNQNGEVLWANVIGNTGNDCIENACENEEGNYVVCGYFDSSTLTIGGSNLVNKKSGSKDMLLLVYNAQGQLTWKQSYGGTDSDNFKSICKTADGGYLIAGSFYSKNLGLGENQLSNDSRNHCKAVIIKYDNNNNVEYIKTVGGDGNSVGINYILSTLDDGFIIGGYYFGKPIINGEQLNDSTSSEGLIIKFDSVGEIEWYQTIAGQSTWEEIEEIVEIPDVGYIACGYTNNYSTLSIGGEKLRAKDNGYLIKLSQEGEYGWGKVLGDEDTSISSLCLIGSEKIMIGGAFDDKTIGVGKNVLVNKGAKESTYHSDGMVVSLIPKEMTGVVTEDVFGITGEKDNAIQSVEPTSDGGYLALRSEVAYAGHGEHYSYGSGYKDDNVIKYNKNGEVQWTSYIGETRYDEVIDMCQTTDDSCVVVGRFYGAKVYADDYSITKSGDIGRNFMTVDNPDCEIMIIKYDQNGNVKWGTAIEGYPTKVCSTQDGGFVVLGYTSKSVEIGNTTYTSTGNQSKNIAIKFDSNGNIKWSKELEQEDEVPINYITELSNGDLVCIGSETEYPATGESYTKGVIIKLSASGDIKQKKYIEQDDRFSVKTICKSKDGGFVIGVDFDGDSIKIGSYEIVNNSEINNRTDIILIKCDSNGNVEWVTFAGGDEDDKINSIRETSDGGYVIGGYFESHSLYVENYGVLYNYEDKYYNQSNDGIVIKYDSEGNAEWAYAVSGGYDESVNYVCELLSGEYIVGGTYTYNTTIDGFELIGGRNRTDSMIVKLNAKKGVEEQEELVVENKRKEYRITTGINEINNVKGGTISGENLALLEKVKYGDSNAVPIVITPDDGYEIIDIKVNDKEISFEPLADGSYIMPEFNDVRENKNIVATFAKIDNKFIINKVDSVTGEKLKGAQFRLDQIDEREDPEETGLIGTLTRNGETYTSYVPDYTTEIEGVVGDLATSSTYYFVDKDGKLVPTNSRTWQLENVAEPENTNYTTANSYIPIDLTGITGDYQVVVDARVNCENYSYGYATIRSNTTVPRYYDSSGRFMYITGEIESKNYISSVLEGGNTYYLHLGYYKDLGNSNVEDQVVINSVKVYPAVEEYNTYNFIEEEGKIKSTNQGIDNTTCSSFIPVDLTGLEGKYYITVHADISSQTWSDYGFIAVTKDTNRVEYNETDKNVRIYDTTEDHDYSVEVDGGDLYYLHIGYYKNYELSGGDDTLTINSITIDLSPGDLYHSEIITTNSEGQAITNVPFGKYAIVETMAPEGYVINNNATIVEFRHEENAVHEYTIQNEKQSHVIVHHYEKGTTEKVAEDEYLGGHQGEAYSTLPKTNLREYKLEEVDGYAVLPDNLAGTYTYDDIIVNYYYIPKEIPLIVQHYVDGTLNGVPLADGNKAESIVIEGNVGDTYVTEAIDENLLDPKYELVEVPDNSSGTYEYEEVVVTYNYRVKDSAGYVVHHVNKNTGEKIAEDEMVSGGQYGDNYTTNESNDIPANYTYDSRSDNWEGTLVDTLTEITYYYLKSSELKTLDVNKTSTTTLINDKNQVVDYRITYSGTIDEYIGKAKVRIIDNLPYEIDESLSNLNGGTYDRTNKTVTWEDSYAGINTYEDGPYNITLNKNITLVYKDIDLTSEKITNSISGNLITYDGDEEHERIATKELDIPQEIKGKVVVKYLDKKTNEEIEEEVTHSARIGTDYDVSDDVKTIDGYELVEEPQEKTGTYTEADQEKVYKYSKKIEYTVEYYYDNIKDETKTETKEGLEETSVENYTNKVIDGYKLDRIENLPLTLDRDGNNVIKVYYTKDSFNYSVEYYYDDVKDDSKTVNGTAVFGSTIDTYEDKVIDGYKLDDEENLPLTITSNSNNNVIRIYYVKDEFEYTVEYYFNGVKDDTLTETDTAEFGSRIEDYTDKVKIGYIYSRAENLPLIITSNPDNNIIKIYYIIDDGQTKEISYFIEYYKDDILQENDTKKITNIVQLLDPETLVVNRAEVLEQDKYVGYTIDRTEPEDITDTINSGSTIKVFYKKRNDIAYKILFKEKITEREIAESEGGKGTYQDEIRAEDNIIDINGYVFDSYDKEKIILSANEIQNVITIYYTKKNDLKYTVHYLDKDTNVEIKESKEVNNQTYQDEVLSQREVIVIDGYEYDSADKDRLIISSDESLNSINLYYKKRTDLSYIVRYIDIMTKEEIAESKIVNNKTFGEIINCSDEVIEFEKYNFNSLKEDTITIGTGTNEVIVYYIKHYGTLWIWYIDQLSGESVRNSALLLSPIDTPYEVEIEDVDGYVFVTSKGELSGVYEENTKNIYLYYRKEAKVKVKYLDYKTNEEIADGITIEGYVGKRYTTEEKEIAGYKLAYNSGSTSGYMTEEDIEIAYYYGKYAKVTRKSINSYTNELLKSEDIPYAEGDNYYIEPESIEGYDLDESKMPNNYSGVAKVEGTDVDYYYKEKATLTIEYVDENGNKIVNDKVNNLHVGDAYEVDKILIDGYNFRGLPDNYKGTIENSDTVVRLIYDTIYTDESKANTTIPRTMDKNMTKAYIIGGMAIVSIYSVAIIIKFKIAEKKKKFK